MAPKLHMEIHGSGEREIVICNGLSQSTANWRGVVRHNRDVRWILYDARGHGRSDIGETPYTLDGHVADLRRVMTEAECKRPVVMGFSHGGRVALRAVAEYPEWFSGLVLISTGSEVHAKRRAYVQSWANCLRLGGVEALAWSSLPSIVGRKILERFPDLDLMIKGSVSRNQEAGLKATFAGMMEYPEPRLDAERVTLPTLVVRGGEDPLVSENDDHNFSEWIGQVDTLSYSDCGHTLPLEEPERFNRDLANLVWN